MRFVKLAGCVLSGFLLASSSTASPTATPALRADGAPASPAAMSVLPIQAQAPASIGPPRYGRPLTAPLTEPIRSRESSTPAAPAVSPWPRGASSSSPGSPLSTAADTDAGAAPSGIGGGDPLAPESTIPGVCAGGSNPGTLCTAPADCTGGGVCHFTRTDVYRNEAHPFGFISCTLGPNCPEFLDDLTLNSALAFPPARITSVEVGWIVRPGRTAAPGTCYDGPTPGAACTGQTCGTGGDCTTLNTGKTMRVEVRFWDNLDAAAPPGSAVNSGYLGGVSFLVSGPLAAGATGTAYTHTVVLPFAAGLSPTDRTNIGLQVDFLDDATNGFTTGGGPLFAGSGVSSGSSANLFWTDDDTDGTFEGSESFFFTSGPPTLSNAYAHLGAELPVQEQEPNGTQSTATYTGSCLTLNAAIDPSGDVDWYKFTLPASALIESDVLCGSSSDDSTLTLRDANGAPLAFNDDASPTTRGSSITSTLAAGTYLLEVHEKNDDGVIASYNMRIGPPPPIVKNLRMGAACSPMCTNKHSITWDPLSVGGIYDVAYGDLQLLHSAGLNASFGGCLGEDLPGPFSDDTDTPAPGQGFYYMARGRDGCTGLAGTYDEGGESVTRDPSIPAPPIDCSRP